MGDYADQVAQAIAAQGGTAPSAKFWIDSTYSKAPNVYTGGTPTAAYAPPTQSQIQGTSQDLVNDLYAKWATRDPQFNDISKRLYNSGLISKSQLGNPIYTGQGIERAASVYQAYAGQAGASAVSFKDWFDWYTKNAADRAAADGSGAYKGPTTTTSYSITDRGTATELLNKAAEDMIGRRLTDKELDKYVSQFNAQEKANPQVTTSDNNGKGTASSVTKTAMDKQAILNQIIAKNPDFADYQIDTGLMDWFSKRTQRGQQVRNG